MPDQEHESTLTVLPALGANLGIAIACVRLGREPQDSHREINEVFLESVPRDDPELRARVLARYSPRET